jgi:hypothetical protein
VRTTLDIDEDILAAARELGRRERRTVGKVISSLARRALTGLPSAPNAVAEPVSFYGFEPLPPRGVVVTDELIDRLREENGD